MINSFMLQWNFMVATQMSSWSFNIVEELLQKHYLSLPLSPGEMHLLQHLGALLHNKSLLIGESRDITIVLFSWKHRTQVLFKKKKRSWNMKYEIKSQLSIHKLTISTTSTSASSRRWYKNIWRSFFIWILLSSIWATVKIRILHFLHTWQRHGQREVEAEGGRRR